MTAPLVYVPDLPGGQAGHGCDPADYQKLDIKGKLALVQRGTCTFALKTELALNAGAAGIYSDILFAPERNTKTSVTGLILFNNVPGGPISSRCVSVFSPNAAFIS